MTPENTTNERTNGYLQGMTRSSVFAGEQSMRQMERQEIQDGKNLARHGQEAGFAVLLMGRQ